MANIETELHCAENGTPLTVTATQHAKKGDIVTEYVCVPRAALQAPAEYLRKHHSLNANFRRGFIQALNCIDWTYALFGDLPQTPSQPHVPPRKKIKIGPHEYYEDEVLDRIKQLPSTTSVWRK